MGINYLTHEQAGRGTPKAAQRGGRPTARPPDITMPEKVTILNGSPEGDPPRRGAKQGARRAGKRPRQAPPAPAAGAAGGPPPERRGPEPATAGDGTPQTRSNTPPARFSACQTSARRPLTSSPPPPIHGICNAFWRVLGD